MPVLSNQRHELFAQALAKGQTQTAAYVKAGYKDDRGAAARLSAKVNIMARVEELKERAAAKCELTIADLVAELEQARAIALQAETPQSSAAVSATMGKAKLLGYGGDKATIDLKSSDGTMTPKVLDVSKLSDAALKELAKLKVPDADD